MAYWEHTDHQRIVNALAADGRHYSITVTNEGSIITVYNRLNFLGRRRQRGFIRCEFICEPKGSLVAVEPRLLAAFLLRNYGLFTTVLFCYDPRQIKVVP
jgi:hypothetical protein